MTIKPSISLLLNNALVTDLDVIGDRWSLLILRDVFMGRHRFEELRVHTGASKATLSRRLDSLIEAQILCKTPGKGKSKRHEYHLGEKGKSLFGASMLAWQWESHWFDCEANVLPHTLYHTDCGKVFQPKAVCRHCNAAITLEDIIWPQAEESLEHQLEVIRSSNKQRRVRAESNQQAADPRLTQISDLIGDRWTLLLLIAAFLGISRNDGFANQLSIASNILSQRLNMLVSAGIFSKQQYQQNPPRFEYRLTEKAKSLYPLIMYLRQWAMGHHKQEEVLLHKSCKKPLSIKVACSECNEELTPNSVVAQRNT